MSEMDFNFTTDAPINEPEHDRFRRWPFAQRVAQTIAFRRDPSSIVIGIYGAWGDGKSSVLNFIHKELRNHENVIVVKFNPWLFGSETQIIQNFFQVLAESLGKSLTKFNEKIGGWLEKYGSVLSATPFAVGEAILKDIGRSLNTVEVEDYRARLEKLLKEQNKRVVIFMDDIDRLDKTEIQSVFKLVKLMGDFSHTNYILAFDEEMVAAALSEKYGSGGVEAGRHFLEKIVQVPLQLPVVELDTLREYCFEGVDEALHLSGIELTQSHSELFVRHFVDGLQNRIRTPRMAKRYGNALTFALPILKNEVNSVDLMLVEGIRIFYPRLYDHIRTNPNLYIGNRYKEVLSSKNEEMERELLEQGLSGLSKSDRKSAESLILALFPKVKSIIPKQSFWSDSSPRGLMDKRVSSEAYFSRYFLYSVPDNDVSDTMVSLFLAELETLGEEEMDNRLSEMVNARSVDRLVEKLRYMEEDLSEKVSKLLAKSISRSGHLFSNNLSFFSFLTTFTQAAILASKLLRNVSFGDARLEASKAVICEGKPLDFVVELFIWMTSDKDGEEVESIGFSVDEKVQLQQLIVEKIKQQAEQDVLYVTMRSPMPILLIWAEYGSREETNQYLKNTFENDKSHVVQFIKQSVNRRRTLGSNSESLAEFNQKNYDDLKKIVDAEVIFHALKELFGEVLENSVYETHHIEPSDLDFGMQFAFVHKQAVETIN